MRRSVDFWITVAPFFAEFQLIKARARWEQRDARAEIDAFHMRSAAEAVSQH